MSRKINKINETGFSAPPRRNRGFVNLRVLGIRRAARL